MATGGVHFHVSLCYALGHVPHTDCLALGYTCVSTLGFTTAHIVSSIHRTKGRIDRARAAGGASSEKVFSCPQNGKTKAKQENRHMPKAVTHPEKGKSKCSIELPTGPMIGGSRGWTINDQTCTSERSRRKGDVMAAASSTGTTRLVRSSKFGIKRDLPCLPLSLFWVCAGFPLLPPVLVISCSLPQLGARRIKQRLLASHLADPHFRADLLGLRQSASVGRRSTRVLDPCSVYPLVMVVKASVRRHSSVCCHRKLAAAAEPNALVDYVVETVS